MDPLPHPIFFPFSILYGIIVRIRNLLYNRGICKSHSADVPVICVGNISVGGTGKTPMVEYLLNLLIEHYNTTILSRGYKRKTKGFVIASPATKFHEIGDEPFQYHSKYPEVSVTVSENRVKGIKIIRELLPETNVILMDDGMQHRSLKPGLLICLIDYSRPIWKDLLLPAGRLREPSKELKRAQIVIVTKCPSTLSIEEQEKIKHKISNLNKTAPVFFSSIQYHEQLNNLTRDLARIDLKDITKCFVFTGIANARPIYDYLNESNISFETAKFPDHHHFTFKDIDKLEHKAQGYDYILTTEKDAGRLTALELPENLRSRIFSLSISMKILNNEEEKFSELVYDYLDTALSRNTEIDKHLTLD